MKKPTPFLRESTGLVREIGPWTALLMNTAFIAFQSGFILLVSSMFNFPKGNPLIAIAISALLFLPLTILLNKVGITYYRTASDYVFITRNLHPSVGFATMFMFTVDQMFFNAVLISLGIITGLAPAILAIGISDNAPSLVSLGNSLMSSPLMIFLMGSVIFTILVLINIVSSRAGTYLASAISLFGIATFALTIILLHVYAPQIINAIKTTAPNILSQAVSTSGGLPSNGMIMDTIYLIPYLAYVFPFVNFVLSVGGEVRRGRAMPMAIFGTYVLSAVFLILGVWITISSIGINRLNGLFAIYYGVASGVSWPSSLPPPYPQALLIMVLRNPLLQWLIVVGSFTWYINVVSVLIIQIARYLLALSFDRVLPSFLAYVSPRTHTPITAHITDLVITLVIMYLYNFSVVPLLSATMDVSTLVTILMYFMIITITAIVLGVRTKSKVTAVLGIYMTALFAWIAYEEVMNPMAYLFVPSINAYIIGFFAALFAIGITVYYAVRLYRLRREGIDVNMLFKEIPPE
ncbi:APC family permease [Vulcanisaeta sp. JCM 16159]|uniref:APC family permease n=1 Tax=Vulcanisaeta sp. JCM 16159 TaxID=1295371 RepID=UPI0006CFD924|nr:amino acid permease [Vulcanisaeta sp. JCM 16159]